MADAAPSGSLIAGKYRVVRLLGAGGMGMVFEAQNELTEKRVAIKRLRPELATRPDHVQRMLREAQASARIQHPSVVDVYDVACEGDTLFLVMEYLEGETLAAYLKRGGHGFSELLELLVPAMRGVAAGHAHGIVHRDIKPQNIFLARVPDRAEPATKVLDFGISKMPAPLEQQSSLTASGALLGSPHYMSFEQLNGARDIDARSDVYGFGVILYQALTGRTPYTAETLGGLAVQVATTTPPRPSALSPDVPFDLDEVVMRAIARDRDARFDSLDALISALAPFRNDHGSNLTEPTRTLRASPSSLAGHAFPGLVSALQPRTRFPRARFSRPTAVLVTAAGLLLALGLAAMLQRRSATEVEDRNRAAAVLPTLAETPPARSPSHPGTYAEPVQPTITPALEPSAALPERETGTAPLRPGAEPPLSGQQDRIRKPDKARSLPAKSARAPIQPARPVGSHEPASVTPATRTTGSSAHDADERRYRAGKPSLDEF